MKRSSGPRKTADLSDSVQQHLNSYTLAASAAGVGLLALAQPAEAKIVYTHTHQVIPEHGEIFLDLNHDGIRDFAFAENSFLTAGSLRVCGGPSFNSSCNVPKSSNLIMGYGGFASALRAGTKISANKRFGQGHEQMAFFRCKSTSCQHIYSGGPWLEKTDRYLGFKFLIKGKVHYGWARLNVGKYGVEAVLTGYAYETIPNKPIIAGETEGPEESGVDEVNPATPDEPTPQSASLGLLAMGSPGLTVWRREESVLAAP